jgi:hypothetical protein
MTTRLTKQRTVDDSIMLVRFSEASGDEASTSGVVER